MFDWIGSALDKVAQYLLDFLVWLMEYVFWIFDSLFRSLWALAQPYLLSVLDKMAQHLPNDLMPVIAAAYAWFQYVNEWVPIEYAIGLFITYYVIASTLYCYRLFMSLFPVGRV